MKKFITVSFLLLLIILFNKGFSQEYSHDYKKITKDELEMTSYPKDPDADAVVIYDIGKSHFFLNSKDQITMGFERRTKIKILNKAGFNKAEISIPFYIQNYDPEKVQNVDATSYTFENGKLVSANLDQKNVFEEKLTEHWNILRFAIPNIKEGTVIEYSYNIESQFYVNFRDWDFQWDIPVIYSEYEVRMIPMYEYSFLLQGAKKFDAYTSREERGEIPTTLGLSYNSSGVYNDMVHDFVMKELPAFRDESFITTREDYIVKIDFQLAKINNAPGYTFYKPGNFLSTWPELCNELLKDPQFGKYITTCQKESAKILSGLKLSKDSLQQNVEKIVNYVKSNFKWNEINSISAYKKAADFLRDKEGNSANINLFLLSLFNQASIPASPVILSTRENGKIKVDYPYIDFFNYVVIMIKDVDKVNFYDATSSLSPYNEIPIKCINDKGLVVIKDSQEWVDLNNVNYVSSIESVLKHQFSLSLDSVLTNETITADGVESVMLKQRYPDHTSFEKENKDKGIFYDSLYIRNYNSPDKPFIISYHTRTPIDIIDG
jgi:hypothetical protein